MPRVRIVSTGGTIASTAADGEASGKTPTLSGDDLLEAVPELDDHAEIEVDDVRQVSGFQATVADLVAVLDAVERAAADGVDGVVVTHGTDTMEETVYAIDLACGTVVDRPVVCTGAQRPADRLGTDGPANLLAAVRAAADDRVREGGGTYLAFDDELHAARWVTKAHTSALGTFESPGTGPVGEFAPDGLRFFREPRRYSTPIPDARPDSAVRVELITNALGVDGRRIERAVEDGADGIVVAGTGLGNTTAELGAAIESAIAEGLPIVLASRCHAGTTAGLYGGPGGGATLLDAGAIPGGDRQPWKARIELLLALSAGLDAGEIRTQFEESAST